MAWISHQRSRAVLLVEVNFRTYFAPISHLFRSKEGCLSYRSCDTDEEYGFGFEKGKPHDVCADCLRELVGLSVGRG